MAKPRDLVARQPFVEIHQRLQQPVGGAFGVFDFMLGEEFIFLAGAVFHPGEVDVIHVRSLQSIGGLFSLCVLDHA